MKDDRSQSLTVVRRQLAELDTLERQTLQDLNTVAGAERIAHWKSKTAAVLAQTMGRHEALAFAAVQPGPSFTNDLVEEFTDLVDCYRTSLTALAKRLAETSHPGG
ncbi:MAG: hypothetical protein NNA20_04965 [Nitrospira sp.]|nr:hypothetical protein [Nitrospira sp.]MCP9441924.1 hypothetical protein [Nitrospira sp.]